MKALITACALITFIGASTLAAFAATPSATVTHPVTSKHHRTAMKHMTHKTMAHHHRVAHKSTTHRHVAHKSTHKHVVHSTTHLHKSKPPKQT